MQARLAEFGRADLDRRLRLRLADLAPVIDLDFDDPFTRDLRKLKDAYHFNASAARNIVGEVGQLLTTSAEVRKAALKVRTGLACPTGAQGITRELDDGIINMTEGTNCKIWRRANDRAR